MKNIHVLPTEKPSLLHKAFDKAFILSATPTMQSKLYNSQPYHIYITSDEEIKDGDWCIITNIATGWVFVKQSKGIPTSLSSPRKKIILTTDQDLIKDGVQAIDDEFLEWFVKNPSCERVEWSSEKIEGSFDGEDWKFKYGTVIPRTTQQIINEDYSGGLEMGQIPAKEEPKQETLEYGLLQHIKLCLECNNESQAIRLLEKYGFEKQEQDKNKYSLDEIKLAIKISYGIKYFSETKFLENLEQFKKK